MAMSFLNYTHSSLNFENFKKYPKNSNLISFWAFLASIFIYISVFYVFSLSPSSLLCTPKFWFIISNTLILIIAADFSASKDHHDFYDEYRNINTRTNNVSSFEIQYVKIDEKKKMPKYRKKEVYEEPAREKIIRMVENTLPEILKTNEKAGKLAGKRNESFGKKVIISNLNPEVKIDQAREVKKKEAKCVDRCNSEKSNILAENKEKIVPRKTLSEKYDNIEETRLEENEFSKMTDEELNRRVEEFIRRFNRQIRLQAVRGNGS